MTTPPIKVNLKLVEEKCKLTPEAAADMLKRALAAHCANPTLMDVVHGAFDCEVLADGRLVVVFHHTTTHTSVFHVDAATADAPDGVKFAPLSADELEVTHKHPN